MIYEKENNKIENLKVPVYSKLKVKDLIASIDGKVVTNKTLNTEELGKQEVKPLVWLSGSYSARVGSNLNLEDEIFCADNYDSNPTCKIEGTYDLNKAGTYNLTYVAKDCNNNEERINFILNVYEPAPATTTLTPDQTEQREEVVTAFNDVVRC